MEVRIVHLIQRKKTVNLCVMMEAAAPSVADVSPKIMKLVSSPSLMMEQFIGTALLQEPPQGRVHLFS